MNIDHDHVARSACPACGMPPLPSRVEGDESEPRMMGIRWGALMLALSICLAIASMTTWMLILADPGIPACDDGVTECQTQ